MESKLTPKQKAFADNYIENGGNATAAAVSAGYSKKTARVIGQENLLKPAILGYIAGRQKILDSEKIATLQEIQEIRTSIARNEESEDFARLKATDSLEKALRIKEEQEEKQRAAEEALRNKTYHMDLDNIPDAFHAAIRAIRNRAFLEYVFKGGRGSTKSTDFGMIIIELMKNYHNIHAVIVRKVANTIGTSVFNKVKWAIKKQEFEEDFRSITSPYEITLKATGQKIYFRGADDPDKIKSIAPEFGYIGILWFEELDQFSGYAEVRNIIQSVVRGGEYAWIFMSFNPPKTANNWANEEMEIPKPNRLIHHSTYKDVPREWLGQPFIDEAEHLKEVNPEAYEHEYEGIPNGNGGNVFEYLRFETITDEQIKTFDRIFQGVDWGWFPDAYAFIRAYYDRAHETIYFIDENYVHKTSNEETANWIKEHGYDDYTITCDSNENKSVTDYRDRGLQARAAEKGPGSVEYGFKWLQRRTLVIDRRRTPHVADEFKRYEYDRDKDGNIISGYPEGQDDHTIAATRYAFESLFNKRGNSA